MKATTTILAAVLALSINVLNANNDGDAVNSETTSFHISLAPSTPSEATFEELNEAVTTTVILAPVTPVEADFSDAVSETFIDISTLAPATPGEADFASDDETVNASTFAPVTPPVGDFSDSI
jgi:hypothetical protein